MQYLHFICIIYRAEFVYNSLCLCVCYFYNCATTQDQITQQYYLLRWNCDSSGEEGRRGMQWFLLCEKREVRQQHALKIHNKHA